MNTKICYVIIILLLLTCLNYSQSLEAPVEGESYVSYTEYVEEYKPVIGFFAFLGFVLYGFVLSAIFILYFVCNHSLNTSKLSVLNNPYIQYISCRYPVWTRLGCVLGYCKPSQSELADTDHIIDQEEGLVIPDDQRKAIRLEVAEALRQMGIVEALRKQGYDIVPLDPDNIEL